MSGDDRQFFAKQIDEIVRQVSDIVGPMKQDLESVMADIRRLDKIEAEMSAVKAALRETNIDIRSLDKRIGSIENQFSELRQDMGNTHAMAFDALRSSKQQEKRIIENEVRTV